MMLHTSRQCSTTRPTGSRRRTKQEVTDKQSKVNYTGAVMRRAGQNTKFVVSNAFSRALRCPVPVGAGSGSKGWWRPSDTQNTQHIARLGREVQPEPAKEGRKGADGLTRGVMFGTEGSIPSLGTTAVMRTTAQRQNSSSEGRSRTSHKAGNRINGGSNPPPATKRSDALHEFIIGLG